MNIKCHEAMVIDVRAAISPTRR